MNKSNILLLSFLNLSSNSFKKIELFSKNKKGSLKIAVHNGIIFIKVW